MIKIKTIDQTYKYYTSKYSTCLTYNEVMLLKLTFYDVETAGKIKAENGSMTLCKMKAEK